MVDGASKARAAPRTATSTKMMSRVSQPRQLPRARTIDTAAVVTWQTRMMVRRSDRSATWPTISVSTTIGRNCAKPTSPRSKALPVMVYIVQPIATASIWNDMEEAARTNQNTRKEPCWKGVSFAKRWNLE